jgi:gliding motility-associated-like protein
MNKVYIRILFLSLLLFFGFQLKAANYYWVGGAGSWSQISHWSTTSGGLANQPIIPGPGDNVFFDANSGFTLAAKTVTLDANGFCNNMTWSNVANSPSFITTNATFVVQLQGSLVLSPTTTYQAIFAFKGSAASTLTTNGTVLGQFGMEIDKTSGSLTLTDDLIVPSIVTTAGTNGVTFTSGTFNIAGKNVTLYSFGSTNSNVRTLEMTNTIFKTNFSYVFSGANKTLNATGSTLNTGAFQIDGGVYYKVTATTAAGPNTIIINNSTFTSLTFSPTGGAPFSDIGSGNTVSTLIFNGQGSIGSNNTVGAVLFGLAGSLDGTGNVIRSIKSLNNFTVSGNYTNTVDSLTLATNSIVQFRGTFNITKFLQVAGAACDAFTEINGEPTAGTVNFTSGAVVDLNNVILTGVKATGPITPIAVNGIDGGNNTGFIITEPSSPGTTFYWVGGTGDWNDKSHWSLSSGGVGGACVPFKNDNVVFDANSGLAGRVVTTTSASFCKDFTWAAGVGTVTFNESATSSFKVYGSVVLQPTVTMNSVIEFYGNSAATLTMNGANLGGLQFYIIKTGGGSVTMMDNWISPTNGTINLSSGNLNMAGRTVSVFIFTSSGNATRSLDITNAKITTNLRWQYLGSNKSMTATGSYITAQGTFQIDNLGSNYPRVDLTETAGEKFIDINSAVMGQVTFTNTSATSVADITSNNTIRRLEFKGAGSLAGGGNNIDSLILAGSRNYAFSGINTINKYIKASAATCSGLTELKGNPTGTLAFGSAAVIDINNVYLQNMTATGAMTPIAINGADAGGNSGWTINSTTGNARYWVGGAGDWNDSNHWSTTSGGTGGACVPTVSDDVYFNSASGFTAASKTVTINNGNAYCRNVDWTGAANSPVWSKSVSWKLEVWGDNVTLNPAVTYNVSSLTLKGSNAATMTGTAPLGNFDIEIDKPGGSLTMNNDYTNTLTDISLKSGAFNVPGRILSVATIDNSGLANATSIDISNATITAITGWKYSGATAAHSLNATGSTLTTPSFTANGFAYNKVNISGVTAVNGSMTGTTIDNLVFTNPSTTSAVGINGANNTLNYVEYKGSGGIYFTGNTIKTLVFFPGNIYTLTAGTNTTVTNAWFGSGTPCRLTEIVSSSTSANATLTKTSGTVDLDYIRLRRITAAGVTPFKAGEHSVDLLNNVNWTIAPYNNTATIVGLGPDKTLLSSEFPYTIRTDGFFASPLAQFQWKKGATVVGTGSELIITTPGTYSVDVTYPDGCASTDQIVITQANVDLSVVNTVDKPAPAFGSQVVFTVVATNNGGLPSSSVTVTDLLPAGYTYKSALPSVGTYDVATGIWNIGTLAGGASATLTITTMANATGAYGATATITGSEIDVVPANNTATATTVPVPSVLSIVKNADAAEPGTNGSFTISLPTGVTILEDITVAYNVTGTATAGTDYTAIPVTTVLLAGQNSVSLPVTVINESLIELSETVILTLTGGTSTNFTFAASSTNNTATVNITDDDNILANRTISVAPLVTSVNEPTGTRYVISLPAGIVAPENITVSYTMSGTATSGTDYQAFSGTATILAGTNNIEVIETTLDDQTIEPTETMIMSLTAAATTNFGTFNISATAGSAILNIIDNDNTLANKTLSIVKTTDAAEPGTSGGFKVSLPTGVLSSANISVTYGISASSTATSGTDYQAISGAITIPAGQNSVTVPVNVVDNTIIESTETVIMNITGGSDANNTYTANGAANSATVNITDNDFAGNNNIVLLTKVSDAIEGGANGSYRIALPPGVTSSQDVIVTFNTTGSAILTTDYSLQGLTAGNIVIPAGSNEVLININASTDALIEGPENVILNLTGATSGGLSFTIDATSNGAVVNIVDATAASSTALQIIAGANATEPAANGSFTVRLAGGATSAWPITVGYSVAGTATAGVDYQALGTITIPANTNSVIVPITVIDDQVIEPTEQLTITILSGSATDGGGNAFIFPADGSSNNLTITLSDNDTGASNRTLTIAKASDAAEPTSNGAFTISLPTGYSSASPITMTYTLTGSTATNVADYTIGTIVLPAYTNRVTVPITVVDDQVMEPSETVILILDATITDGTFSYTKANTSATLNIVDDENVAANRVLTVSKQADGAEGVSNGAFAINLPAGIVAPVAITVNYAISGTASSGLDFTALGTSVVIPAGQNGVTIPVTIADDLVIENTESIILKATGATAIGFAFTISGTGDATVNITDNDNTVANRVLKVVVQQNGAEGVSPGHRFNIIFPTGVTSSEAITFNYTVGGSAVFGTDFTSLPQQYKGSGLIGKDSSGGALTAFVVDDQLIEGTENVIITLTSASSGNFTFTIDPTGATAIATIADNDNTLANKTLSITKVTDGAEPATNGAFKISLPPNILPTEDITVNYTVSGTATSGTDYTALSGNVTIPAGQNSANLTVPVLNDAVYDDLETVIVTLNGGTSTNFTFTGNGSATVTITDDESAPPTITSFTPPSGVAGTVVTITGTNFTGATSVAFNGTEATFIVNSATSITATVGVGTTTGLIKVTTPAGIATSLTNFTILNTQPFTVADSYTTPLNVAYADNLLTNDSDPDGNTLIASLVSAPAHGAVVLNANGTFTYTPNANYTGTDSFQYQACDNGTPSLCKTALVTIEVENTPNPAIVSVTSSNANGTYKLGDVITIVATFNQNVTVAGGSPELLLDVTSPGRSAQYTSGSGTNTLTFTYTVQAGDQSADLEYILGSSLALNGGTIKNTSNLDAMLTLPASGPNSLGGSKDLVIDGVVPVIVSVAVPAPATYVAGQNLDFVVNYSEAVTINTVGGAPRLAITLDIGGTVYANYLSGSGTTAHIYRFVAATGQQDLTGIALASVVELNGSTQADAAGNNAALTLNNVAATSAVLVDAFPPGVVSINRADTNPVTGTSVTFTVTFSEAVTGVDLNDFSLALTATATGNIASIVPVSSGVYSVTVNNITGNGTLGLNLNATGTGIADLALNPIATGFTGELYTILPTADLAITKTASSLSPIIGSNVVFTLTATNNGPRAGTGITVTDQLAAGYTFVSATPTTGTYNAATGVWAIGSLANGANTTIAITAKVNALGNYINSAAISGSENDPNPANNVSSITLTPVNNNLPVTDDKTNAAVIASTSTTPVDLDNPTGSDTDGTVVAYIINTLPAKGTLYLADGTTAVTAGQELTVAQANGLKFVPSGTGTGVTTFSLSAKDNDGGVDATPATFTVNIGNNLPVTDDKTNAAVIASTSTTPVDLDNPTGSDTDGTVVAYIINTLPAKGTLYLADGTTAVTAGQELTVAQANGLKFVPSGTGSGAVSFSLSAKDNDGVVDATPATFTVNIGNNLPVTDDKTNAAVIASTVTIAVDLDNPTGSDTDGTVVAYIINTLPAKGTLYLADGTTAVTAGQELTVARANGLKFVPSGTGTGVTTFSLSAKDNDGGVDATPATFTVNIGNNLPSTDDKTNAAVIASTSTTPVDLDNPTGSDTDGTVVAYLINTLPAKGTLYLADGTTAVTAGQELTVAQANGLKFVPSGTGTGVTTFSLSAKDNDGGVDATPATFTINIKPVGINDNDLTPLNVPVTTIVKANDGSTAAVLTVVKGQSSQNGSIVVNANGSITYTPNNNFIGQDSYTYKLRTADGILSDDVIVNINVYSAALSFNKTTSGAIPTSAGSVLNYNLIVTNSGNIAITNIVVTDANAVVSGSPIASLAPGASVTLTAVHDLTQGDVNSGSVTNQASATGKDPKGNNVIKVSNDPSTTVADDATVTIIQPSAAISMVKTASFSGNKLTYTFTITNLGSVSLNTVTLTDAKLGITNKVLPLTSDLAPGASVVNTEIYTLTQADKDLGIVTNTATVNAKTPFNTNVSDVSGTADGNNTLTVISFPKSPIAFDDKAETKANHSVIINVLANDDPGNSTLDQLTVEIVTQPQHGTVKINAGGTITYTPSPGYTGADLFQYRVKDAFGYYTNVASATLNANFFDIKVPNLFTPNGDGINDVFEIRGLNQYQENQLQIVNRWGNEVFNATNYQNNWTGEGLNEGTYYYLLRVKRIGSNQYDVLKGYITLIRAFKK